MADMAWSMLWKTGLLLLLAVGLGVGATVGGTLYQEEMEQQVATMQSRIKSLRNKARVQEEEQKLLGTYKPLFESLSAKGVFGQEPRLQWLEAVQRVSKEIKLPAPLRYKLELRRRFNPDFTVQKGTYALYASRMELDLDLLHEVDLFHFFDRLKAYAPAIFDIKSCALNPVGIFAETEKNLQVTVHVNAKCQLEWYTMLKQSAGEAT